MGDVAKLITEFGFPVVMAVGMGYFIYYIWQFISNNIQPELDAMHLVVLEYREKDKIQEEIEKKAEELAGKKENEN